MVISMTGFGRGKIQNEGREVMVELKTLNHRFLDINMKLPRALSFLDDEVRKHLQKRITRGRVEVYISYKNKGGEQLEVSLNEPIVEAYQKSFEALSRRFGIKNNPELSTLMSIPDIFTISERDEDETTLRELVFEALNIALASINEMRAKEGTHLNKDILERLGIISGVVKTIDERSPIVVDDYRKKLLSRLKELIKPSDLDEARFNTEVAYLADRSNITEELIRLKSHCVQLEQILVGGGPVGRKLDFLVQEMNREANTIGSKSGDLMITNLVVQMKSELEKIREQIQNLE